MTAILEVANVQSIEKNGPAIYSSKALEWLGSIEGNFCRV